MTFEISLAYGETFFKADVTRNGRDFIVSLVSPAQYEVCPVLVFTIHNDETMAFDNTVFDDKEFMPRIAQAIVDHLHANHVSVL